MKGAMAAMLRKLFVDNAKIVVPLLASIPGAGILYLEISDAVDADPATVFDVGTATLGAVALTGFLIEKAVKFFASKKEEV